MGILDGILGIGNLLLGGAQTASNYKAQKAANETNIKLQQRQQAWEEDMSNTAIQRRRADIEKAGGNPALAFTNGSEASTPVIAPARVEAPQYDSSAINSAMLLRGQLKLLAAQTKATEAEARVKNVSAKNAETWGEFNAETDAKRKAIDYDIIRNSAKDRIRKVGIDADMSAAQLSQFNRVTDSMVQRAVQDARAGQLNLEALENIAKVGGIEAGKASWLAKLIIDLIRVSK